MRFVAAGSQKGAAMGQDAADILVFERHGAVFDKSAKELICPVNRMAYPEEDGIPVVLPDEARELAADEEVER